MTVYFIMIDYPYTQQDDIDMETGPFHTSTLLASSKSGVYST